jgi:hypothetical protein
VLVCVLRECWAQIDGRTPLTAADLDRAEATAQRMSEALGDRLRAPALELRTRALSKLIQHYEELRRMMAYLRWFQGDADTFTPSFWAGRGRRARSQDVAEAGDEGTAVPDVAPPVVPATPRPINGGGPFNA